MKAILFFQEKGLRTYAELEKMAGDTSDRFSQLSDDIKGYESKLKKISEQKKVIKDYSSTKEIYQQYRQSGYNRKFFEEHKEEIMTHKAAKDAFDKYKGKFPSYKELSAEYDKVLSKKRAAYAEYKEVRKDMQTYQTAKYDIDQILGIGKEQEQNKNRERSR